DIGRQSRPRADLEQVIPEVVAIENPGHQFVFHPPGPLRAGAQAQVLLVHQRQSRCGLRGGAAGPASCQCVVRWITPTSARPVSASCTANEDASADAVTRATIPAGLSR